MRVRMGISRSDVLHKSYCRTGDEMRGIKLFRVSVDLHHVRIREGVSFQIPLYRLRYASGLVQSSTGPRMCVAARWFRRTSKDSTVFPFLIFSICYKHGGLCGLLPKICLAPHRRKARLFS